jgi:predicted Zn-dependent protease
VEQEEGLIARSPYLKAIEAGDPSLDGSPFWLMNRMRKLFKMLTSLLLVATVAATALPLQSVAQSPGPRLLRDAEIEGLLRLYAKPIFKAAGLNPGAVKVYLIGDPRINAFVANGQRIFVHTGLITKADTPNEVIGVLAHETGHIAGGHLVQLNSEVAQASKERIIGMLIGAAAVVGGAASGSNGAAQVGKGVLMGSQGIAQRRFLSYQRGMESTADQSALRYLNATGQSARGMITTFEKLASMQLASARGADPYLFSHPMPLERIRNLELAAQKSPAFSKPDSAALQLRHDLAKAKIAGFTNSPQFVFRKYPKSDNSLAARYARSISMFRRGDLKNAIPIIESLTDELPQNPYFWELKGQAYMESGDPQRALAPLAKSQKLLPNNGLIQVLHAQALVNIGTTAAADQALGLLRQAKKTEADLPALFKFEAQAHAIRKDVPRAELATAEYAWLIGDNTLAVDKAKRAQGYFKKGSREWLRATDLLTALANK